MTSLISGIIFILLGIAAVLVKRSRFYNSNDVVHSTVRRAATIIFPVIGILILLSGMFFIADSDKSYVAEWINGNLATTFEPGPKIKLFGNVYPYDRVIAVATPTFVAEKDTDKTDSEGKDLVAVEQGSKTVNGTLPPPLVRFTDSAKGNAYGIIRVSLPLERKALLNIHRELGSIEALVDNVLKNVFRSAAIASARLMSIQDYITKRGSDFDEYFSDQVAHGIYKTIVSEEVVSKAIPTEADKTSVSGESINKNKTTVSNEGKTIEEKVAIVYESGIPVRQGINDIARYGLEVITAKITYINPEARVRKLIGDQRDVEARSALAENKRRASLLEAEAEAAEGQKRVAQVRAKELADKEQLLIREEAQKTATLIQAQKKLEQARLDKDQLVVNENAKKEATLIQAQKQLEEAKLLRETAAVKAEEAAHKKKELILIGEGEAAKKSAIMKADGALKQKLETYERVMEKFAKEFGKQKWVPEIQMGGANTTGPGNEAANLINILTAKTLQDLGLDMNVSRSSLVK